MWNLGWAVCAIPNINKLYLIPVEVVALGGGGLLAVRKTPPGCGSTKNFLLVVNFFWRGSTFTQNL